MSKKYCTGDCWWWALVNPTMANPTEQVFATWWNGLEMAVPEWKSANGIVLNEAQICPEMAENKVRSPNDI